MTIRARAPRAAAAALAIASSVVACRSVHSIGAPPDAAADLADDAATLVPSCPTLPDRMIVATLDPALGTLAGLAADVATVYAVLERPDDHTGTLVRAAVGGGSVEVLARVSAGPSAIALDDSYAYVASSIGGEITRIAKQGSAVTTVPGQAGVAGVVSDRSRVFWTLPTGDEVVVLDLLSAAAIPEPIPVRAPLRAIALAGTDVLAAGDHAIVALSAADPHGVAREVAARCDGALLAVDGDTAYCAEADALVAVRLDGTGARVIASGSGAVAAVVAGAGRVFFTVGRAPGPAIFAVPIDGVGGPTVVEPITDRPPHLAIDACALYYELAGAIVRRSL